MTLTFYAPPSPSWHADDGASGNCRTGEEGAVPSQAPGARLAAQESHQRPPRCAGNHLISIGKDSRPGSLLVGWRKTRGGRRNGGIWKLSRGSRKPLALQSDPHPVSRSRDFCERRKRRPLACVSSHCRARWQVAKPTQRLPGYYHRHGGDGDCNKSYHFLSPATCSVSAVVIPAPPVS